MSRVVWAGCLVALILGIVLPVSPALPAPVILEPLVPKKTEMQWAIYPQVGYTAVYVGIAYGLKNTVRDRFLGHSTAGGLVWANIELPLIFETSLPPPPSNTRYVLTYRRPIAIKSYWGPYLVSGGRRDAPVAWSETRNYEWTFTGGAEGRSLPLAHPLGIRNLVTDDSLIYCPNASVGVANLGWKQHCAHRPPQPILPHPPRP